MHRFFYGFFMHKNHKFLFFFKMKNKRIEIEWAFFSPAVSSIFDQQIDDNNVFGAIKF